MGIYLIALMIFISGIYMIMTADHYIAKIIGLGILQTSIIIFYIAIGKIYYGLPPIEILTDSPKYSNPVTHVLMLTAIVVGFAISLIGCALSIKIHKKFGTLRISELDV